MINYFHTLKQKFLSKKTYYPEKDGFILTEITSTCDNSLQKVYFYSSKSEKPAPLIVHLHEWGCDYSIFVQRHEFAILCKNSDYNYIFPNFRGPNNTPESCMSEKAIQDIDDAIDYAIKNGNVDIDNIVIIGASGGGHATLTMYMKSKYKLKYYKDLEQIVGSSENVLEMRNRSPMYMDFAENVNRENTKLDIFCGINDAYTGTVSVLHSLNFFNKIQNLLMKKSQQGRGISSEEIISIVSRSISDTSIEFVGDRKLLYKNENENIGLYIFDGGHEMLEDYAFKRIKNAVK